MDKGESVTLEIALWKAALSRLPWMMRFFKMRARSPFAWHVSHSAHSWRRYYSCFLDGLSRNKFFRYVRYKTVGSAHLWCVHKEFWHVIGYLCCRYVILDQNILPLLLFQCLVDFVWHCCRSLGISSYWNWVIDKNGVYRSEYLSSRLQISVTHEQIFNYWQTALKLCYVYYMCISWPVGLTITLVTLAKEIAKCISRPQVHRDIIRRDGVNAAWINK